MTLISCGMILNSNSIVTSLNGLIQQVKSKEKKPIQFLNKNYINKNCRTSHWVGHSYLKKLDNNDFFERKQMVQDMEAELNEASKKKSKLKI